MGGVCACCLAFGMVLYLSSFWGASIERAFPIMAAVALVVGLTSLPILTERIRWFDWKYNWSGWMDGMPVWVRAAYYLLVAITAAHFVIVWFIFAMHRPEFPYWQYVDDGQGGVKTILNKAGELAINQWFIRYGALVLILGCLRSMVSWWFPPDPNTRIA